MLLPARMGWQQASAALLASEWITADVAVASGLALRTCPDGTVLAETLALAQTIASFPAHATRTDQAPDAVRPGYGGGRRTAPRGGRIRRPVRRPVGQSRGASRRRARGLSAVRLGVTCFLTDRDMAPAELAGAAESRGFTSLYLPEHTHLPVKADTPPALVEGVRIEDYKRSLDPFVALATRGAGDHHAHPRDRRGARRPARPDRAGQAGGHPRPPERWPGRAGHRLRLEPRRGGRPRGGLRRSPGMAREHVLCMQALWRDDQAEYHGEFVDLDPC